MDCPNANYTLIGVICLSLGLSGCFKEKDHNYQVSITGTQLLEHDKAEVMIDYDLDGYNNYLSGGFYWGMNDQPESGDFEDVYNIQSETSVQYLENLHGNVTYYAQAYIITPGDGDGNSESIYSNIYSFTTPQTPDTACATTVHEMKMEAFPTTVWNMSPMVASQEAFYYSLQSDFDLGNVEFRFGEEPLSGIYHTVLESTPGDFEVEMLADIQETWTCVFQCTGSYDIYVFNDGNGGIEISFCEVTVVTSGGCTSSRTLTGRIGY